MRRHLLVVFVLSTAAVPFLSADALADEWWSHEGGSEETLLIGTSNAKDIIGLDEIAVTAGNLRIGPCEGQFTMDIWNEVLQPEVVTGTGKVTSVAVQTPCQVYANVIGTYQPLSGCVAEQITANTTVPWHVTVLPDTEVDTHDANYLYVLSDPCEEFGVPPMVGVSGTITGQFENREEAGCIVYESSGHLTTPTGVAATISGVQCAEDITLK